MVPQYSPQEIAEYLSAFAEAIEIIWLKDELVDQTVARRAASGLAVLLEDPRPSVAITAGLYQSLLYEQAGRANRALEVLGPALREVPQQAAVVGFFSRLQRCRMLRDQDQPVAAWALLTLLQARCDQWFTDSQLSQAAQAAVLLAQVRLAVKLAGEVDGDQSRSGRRLVRSGSPADRPAIRAGCPLQPPRSAIGSGGADADRRNGKQRPPAGCLAIALRLYFSSNLLS